MIDITIVINFAERASEGMWSCVNNVEDHEDAATAAREIVEYWEGETGLLSGHDAERWGDLEPSEAEQNELRGRCIGIVERAIVAMRTRRATA